VKPWPGYEPVDIPAMFGGLAVYDRYQRNDPSLGLLMRQPHFVIKLPLGGAETGTRLEKKIIDKLVAIAERAFGETVENKVRNCSSSESALETLINSVPNEVPIAVLVDEYDAAIIGDVTKHQWDAANSGIDALRSFLISTKADELNFRIKCFVVTGVARFAHTSLFSGANNFVDLTEHPITSRIFGFTDDEIRYTFPTELKRLGEYHKEAPTREESGNIAVKDSRPVDVAMEELRYWYNGYCFDGQTTTYNPAGVLSALGAGKITGTEMENASSFSWLGIAPTVILDHLRKADSVEPKINTLDIANLASHRVDVVVVAMLQQTGLFTYVPDENGLIMSDSKNNTRKLRPPNQYARNTLIRLLEKFVNQEKSNVKLPEISNKIQQSLIIRDPKKFRPLIFQALSSVAVNNKRGSDKGNQREAPLHTFAYGLLMAAMPETIGTVTMEDSSSSGFADIVLKLHSTQIQPAAVWILEVGVARKDRTPDPVIEKKLIQVKKYFQKYANLSGIAAAIVIDRDGKFHMKWNEWDVEKEKWKDVPEEVHAPKVLEDHAPKVPEDHAPKVPEDHATKVPRSRKRRK